MAAETVFLLPGQGGYTPGVLAGDSASEITEVLEVTDRVAGEFGHGGVSELLTNVEAPSAAELVDSDPFALQLAVFAAAVSGFRKAAREHTPDVLVGHSMGEIAALTVAGAFDMANGARLVCHRSQALLSHARVAGGMVAVGLPESRAEHLVGCVGEPGLAVAVANAPQQTVVAGPEAALATVTAVARALGVSATQLPAPYPFHTPLLGLAAQEFTAAIAGISQRALRMAVYSPVAQGYVSDSGDLKALLARQLTSPVRFLSAVRELHAWGARRFVECGKAGLSGLVRRSVPDVTTREAAPTTGSTAKAEAAPDPAAAAVIAADTRAADPTRVLEELKELYATTLGYPVEAITADADLEADLGIDSLKRAEMLGKITAHFGLAEGADNTRFLAQATLAELAELVASAQSHTR